MRFIPIAGFIGLVILLAILLLTKPDGANDAALVQKPLPTLALKAIDGHGDWNADHLKGHVTLLNFFASWCTPCEAEMPELAAMKKQFPNVHFEGAAWNDEPPTIKKWLTKNGNPFNAVWIDPNGDATMALGLKGIPETLIIDANGNVRYRLSGPVTKAVRANTLDPLIEQLTTEAHAQ